jgi:hypothetical protein
MKTKAWLAESARRILLIIALMVGTAGVALAQCMACASSYQCGPSGTRGDCLVSCHGTTCACADKGTCEPTLIAISRSETFKFAQANPADVTIQGTFLVTDCQGNYRGVEHTSAQAAQVKASLTTIVLAPAVSRQRYAAVPPQVQTSSPARPVPIRDQ